MSVLHYVKCETCEKTHPFQHQLQLPEDWIVLAVGVLDERHFCSGQCLHKWTCAEYGQERDEVQSHWTRSSDARRFVMVIRYGFGKEAVEGALWRDGNVELDPYSDHCASDHRHCGGAFQRWVDFLERHPAIKYDILWIDQEPIV